MLTSDLLSLISLYKMKLLRVEYGGSPMYKFIWLECRIAASGCGRVSVNLVLS